jgi:hypothetical protein
MVHMDSAGKSEIWWTGMTRQLVLAGGVVVEEEDVIGSNGQDGGGHGVQATQ